MAIKMALAQGLMAAGCTVHDIGLALSPMAYFAQFALDVPAVAMVTASHNDNGWTGVKMGCDRPVTFGPGGDGARCATSCSAAPSMPGPAATIASSQDFAERYFADLTAGDAFQAQDQGGRGLRQRHGRRLRAAKCWRRIGIEVIPLDVELDYTFPTYNPNPEDMEMLHAMAATRSGQTAPMSALGFDGDGDRCGVVDNEGNEIFADKIGVMLARDLSALHPGAQFVVDVKSTGLFMTDPVLQAQGAKTDYWKTGHSYIKRRVQELSALAGFEKSGHFFFNAADRARL